MNEFTIGDKVSIKVWKIAFDQSISEVTLEGVIVYIDNMFHYFYVYTMVRGTIARTAAELEMAEKGFLNRILSSNE